MHSHIFRRFAQPKSRFDLFVNRSFHPRLLNNQLRTLLSAKYACDEEWNKRLDSKTLKNISTDRYFFDLNQRYQQMQPVSPVDIDIFINAANRLESFGEVEYLVRRLRQSPRTVDTLESTHHAVCRFYMQHQKFSELLNILNDRIQYGIFPDTFIYNILLDHYLNKNELDQAFDIVKLMMLQEDSGNDITKTLALHTMIDILKSNHIVPQQVIVEEQNKESSENDDEEIEYIRVPYLTNPFFDDHFDLVNREHIFGKSLYFFGYELGKNCSNSDDQLLANTSMIIGLIFFQKWEKLQKTLNLLFSRSDQKGKVKVTSDVIEALSKHIEIFQNEPIKSELEKLKTNFETSLEVDSHKKLVDLIKNRLHLLPEQESQDIKKQLETFDDFEKNRLITLNQQMDQLLHKKQKKELEEQIKDLEEKKRLYYFFENFPKHEIDFVEAEQRIKELRSKNVVEETYVPPEIN